MIELFQQAQQLVLLLNRSGVDYAIAGGLAVGVYGHVRATEDIDVVIPSAADLPTVDALLVEAEWLPHHDHLTFNNGMGLYRRIKVVGDDTIQLDILVPPPSMDLLSDRLRTDLAGPACWIVSPRALRIMKQGTGRAKDNDDLRALDEFMPPPPPEET